MGWLSWQTRTALKQIGTTILVVVVFLAIGFSWDYWNWNSYIFPWVRSWTWRGWLDFCIGLPTLIIIGILLATIRADTIN